MSAAVNMDVARNAAPAGTPPVAAIGIGNVLLGDDGFGPTVLALLAAGWELPADLELIDAGTPGLDLAGLLCGRRAVVFVDAVAAPMPAGTLLRYSDRELESALALTVRVSPHDPALAEALAIAALAGSTPAHVVLIGAVPASVEPALGLSERVERAASHAAIQVAELLASWGLRLRLRRQPLEPELWWHRNPLAGGRP